MKTILMAASIIAAATLAGGSEASAGQAFGLTIAGPNGYIQIGTNGRDHGPHGFDGRDFGRHSGPTRHRFARVCLDQTQVRRNLNRQGWYGFSDLRVNGPAFVVDARNRNGQEYRLRVERCSGMILSAEHIGRRFDRHPHRRGS